MNIYTALTILGLGSNRLPTIAEVKSAFRKYAKENHPDTAIEKIGSEHRFKKGEEARTIIMAAISSSNAGKNAIYKTRSSVAKRKQTMKIRKETKIRLKAEQVNREYKKHSEQELSEKYNAYLHSKLKIGMEIKHRSFGSGIVSIIAETIVTVDFPDFGKKRFSLPSAFIDHFLTTDNIELPAFSTDIVKNTFF